MRLYCALLVVRGFVDWRLERCGICPRIMLSCPDGGSACHHIPSNGASSFCDSSAVISILGTGRGIGPTDSTIRKTCLVWFWTNTFSQQYVLLCRLPMRFVLMLLLLLTLSWLSLQMLYWSFRLYVCCMFVCFCACVFVLLLLKVLSLIYMMTIMFSCFLCAIQFCCL